MKFPRLHSDHTRAVLVFAGLFLATVANAQDKALNQLLDKSADQMTRFVDQFSEVKCTEHVTQERFATDSKDGKGRKIERHADATYDYLVILSNSGGELSLDESRLEIKAPGKVRKEKDQSMPMLVSNGFATLFLIFHPYYSNSFAFTSLGEEIVDGRTLVKVHF